MPSSETLKMGDHVVVPWGVDTREGEVVAIYETGAVERVVVRLSVPEGGEDEPLTVMLPAGSVTPLSEASDLPAPGSWLRGFRYERDVAEALARVLTDIQPAIHLNTERSGTEIDILLETQQGVIIAEVKTVDHLSERLLDGAVRQLRAFMAAYPDAKGLVVTPGALPPSLGKGARGSGLLSRDLGVARWRSADDDKNLNTIIHELLNDGSDALIAADG